MFLGVTLSYNFFNLSFYIIVFLYIKLFLTRASSYGIITIFFHKSFYIGGVANKPFIHHNDFKNIFKLVVLILVNIQHDGTQPAGTR